MYYDILKGRPFRDGSGSIGNLEEKEGNCHEG
jgi:hypothetical protein